MALVRETLSECIGDVDGIRDKCLPWNGQRRQRMSQFLQFVLQYDHNVIEFERVLKKNGLDSLLKIDENIEEDPTPNIGRQKYTSHVSQQESLILVNLANLLANISF